VTAPAHYSLGLDFGTESVRALLVDVRTGRIAAQGISPFAHGVLDRALPNGVPLPPDYALQHPQDWLDSASAATRQVLRDGGIPPSHVIGIGVDFTSCTMLPTLADGTPLCLTPAFAQTPLAWPKLWKHHGAKAEADRFNQIARDRGEPWLKLYGGTISLEWFFPKVLETLRAAPPAHAAADCWLEAGDWLVWQLTDGPFPRCSSSNLIRSACQAGYKACWNARTGYPSPEFLAAVDPELPSVLDKMRGPVHSPGQRAGTLTDAAAELLGLNPGTPVSVATVDAHAGVPGAGVAAPGVMVMVLGTSSCFMVNSLSLHTPPGLAGVVADGILPGFYGYETGQACVGDAFGWVARTTGLSHAELNRRAAALPPGSDGVLAIDWLNGCRTPLMDGRLSGALLGLTLATRPEQIYRAMIEATAFGVRWIIDTLTAGGLAVNAYVAAGGLPSRSPLLMQIYADVLGQPIALAEAEQSVALGAAILGALAAGSEITGHATMTAAIQSMARQRTDLRYEPNPTAHAAYDRLFALYRRLTVRDRDLAQAVRELHWFKRDCSGASGDGR
jgi:L-ribulokinase